MNEVWVTLTKEEAEALHNHVPGEALVRAQDKVREAIADAEVDWDEELHGVGTGEE